MDPVCGMTVEMEQAQYLSTHRGQPFRFCCLRCKEAFDQEPEKYLARARG